MSKLFAALIGLAGLGALLYFSFNSAQAPPEVTFAAASRRALVSTIVTNGKVEPSGYSALRAPRAGVLARVLVEKGQAVRLGQVLAEMEGAGFDAELKAAEARISQARSEIEAIDRGGSTAAKTEIDNSVAAVRLELESARRDHEQVSRLVDKQAETREALTSASDRVRQIEARLEALNRNRAALKTTENREPALARLAEAEAARALVVQRWEQGSVRAPVAGVVFNLPVRNGAFVQPGDLIAELGRRAGAVVAIVYVDEPELGRVAKGMAVKITWDAAPGRVWNAVVDRLPTQILALNRRQIGEVLCGLDNEGGVLPPGANINAEVVSKEEAGALAIPKAALRREGAETGVLVLRQPENVLQWRAVQVGISSITHAAIDGGLREGELVALPGAAAVKAGAKVDPKLP